MALGEAVGLNYKYPFLQSQEPMAGGGAMPQEGASMADLGSLEGLQTVRGDTENVYGTYHKIRGFVDSMWKDYGIDVTKPSFTDEFGMKANRLYQESIAKLHFDINDLKNSQKMLAAQEQKGNLRARTGFDRQAQRYSQTVGSEYITHDIDPAATRAIQSYQEVYDDPKTRYAAEQELRTQEQSLRTKAQQAAQMGDQGMAEHFTRSADAIGSALYSDVKQQELDIKKANTRLRAAELSKANEKDYIDFYRERDNLRRTYTNEDLTERLVGNYGNFDVINATRTVPTEGQESMIRYTKKDRDGKYSVVEVNPNNDQEMLKLYNMMSGSKYTWDEVKGFDKDKVSIPGSNIPVGNINPQFTESANDLTALLQGSYDWAKGIVAEGYDYSGDSFESKKLRENMIANTRQIVSEGLNTLAGQGRLTMVSGISGIDSNKDPITSGEGPRVSEVEIDGERMVMTDENGNTYKIDLNPKDKIKKGREHKHLQRFIAKNSLTEDMFLRRNAGQYGIDRADEVLLTSPSMRELNPAEMVDNKLQPSKFKKQTYSQIKKDNLLTDKEGNPVKQIIDGRLFLYTKDGKVIEAISPDQTKLDEGRIPSKGASTVVDELTNFQ